MFRALILGEAAIILSMAVIAHLMVQNSETLKKSTLAKFYVYGMAVMGVAVFLFSFSAIRVFLRGIFF